MTEENKEMRVQLTLAHQNGINLHILVEQNISLQQQTP